MKRRIMFTMAVAVFAALAVASVAQAASVPQAGTVAAPTVTLDGTLAGHTYSLNCKVRNLTSVRTIVLHHEVMVEDGVTQQLIGIPIPWISDGSRTLGLRYGNGGYWQGTLNFVFTITPPVMPGDLIITVWSASYGTGSAKVTGVKAIQAGVGVP